MCQQYGMDLVNHMDATVNGLMLILIATIELIGVAWLYGADSMLSDIRMMLQHRYPAWLGKHDTRVT